MFASDISENQFYVFFYILPKYLVYQNPNWETTNRHPHTPGVSGEVEGENVSSPIPTL